MPAKIQSPTTTTPASAGTGQASGGGANLQPAGNQAAQDKLKRRPSGPTGRVWNRILGQPEGADTSGRTVDQAMIQAYLDKRIGFAEGEMFRGMKLSGAAESLVKQYDKDGDARLSWPEFEAAEDMLYAMLAPGAAAGKQDAATAGAAQHQAVAGGDGRASLDEVQAMSQKQLPKGTEHADLVAQLGARMAIDAADRDEEGKPTKDRTLSREEWTGAAKEIEAGRK